MRTIYYFLAVVKQTIGFGQEGRDMYHTVCLSVFICEVTDFYLEMLQLFCPLSLNACSETSWFFPVFPKLKEGVVDETL